jgi:signal transduction histidine kinase
VRIRFLQTEGFRLSAIYAAAFALSVLIMGGVVITVTDDALRDQLLQSSRADIAAMAHGYAAEGVPEAKEVMEQLMAAPGGSDFFLLQNGPVRMAGNLPAMTPVTGTTTLPAKASRHEILGAGAFLGPGIYVFSGSDLNRVHAARNRLVHILLWLFGAALLLAILGGTLVSRSFLRRTDAMTRTCRAIMDGDMRARIPVRGSGDELDRLADAINAMLDRIAALMENLRQVTNDIAHDLRTPVTHLRTGLERAESGAITQKEQHQALQAAILRCDEILAMFAALLRIAQIEGGARRASFSAVALAPLLTQMRDVFGAVAEEARHRLEVKIAEETIIRGDKELLTQLLSNLIENAILHTPPDTQINLSLAVNAGRSVVTVSDNGPGVPRDEHARLFQRLYRREASRSRPGHGLGLSIVQAIGDLHGARLRIVDQPGFCVEITFPHVPDTSRP